LDVSFIPGGLGRKRPAPIFLLIEPEKRVDDTAQIIGKPVLKTKPAFIQDEKPL
jgi:hypothetical protein